jgi:hypothetical protein
LGIAQLPFEVLALPFHSIDDRLIDIDRIEQMSATAQVQAQPNRLLPRQPARRLNKSRKQKQARGERKGRVKQDTIV